MRTTGERVAEPTGSNQLFWFGTWIVGIELTEEFLKGESEEIVGNSLHIFRCFATDLRGEDVRETWMNIKPRNAFTPSTLDEGRSCLASSVNELLRLHRTMF